MNNMKRIAIIATLASMLVLPATVAFGKPGAPAAPHACSSHQVKVSAAKCADRNHDGTIEYMSDGTTR